MQCTQQATHFRRALYMAAPPLGDQMQSIMAAIQAPITTNHGERSIGHGGQQKTTIAFRLPTSTTDNKDNTSLWIPLDGGQGKQQHGASVTMAAGSPWREEPEVPRLRELGNPPCATHHMAQGEWAAFTLEGWSTQQHGKEPEQACGTEPIPTWGTEPEPAGGTAPTPLW